MIVPILHLRTKVSRRTLTVLVFLRTRILHKRTDAVLLSIYFTFLQNYFFFCFVVVIVEREVPEFYNNCALSDTSMT